MKEAAKDHEAGPPCACHGLALTAPSRLGQQRLSTKKFLSSAARMPCQLGLARKFVKLASSRLCVFDVLLAARLLHVLLYFKRTI